MLVNKTVLTHDVHSFPPFYGTRILTVEERKEIGCLCKLLIDHGRIEYLQQRGYKAVLQYYIESAVSLENVLLTAVPSPSLIPEPTHVWQEIDLELVGKKKKPIKLNWIFFKKLILCLEKNCFSLPCTQEKVFYFPVSLGITNMQTSSHEWKNKIPKNIWNLLYASLLGRSILDIFFHSQLYSLFISIHDRRTRSTVLQISWKTVG